MIKQIFKGLGVIGVLGGVVVGASIASTSQLVNKTENIDFKELSRKEPIHPAVNEDTTPGCDNGFGKHEKCYWEKVGLSERPIPPPENNNRGSLK